MRFAFPYGSPNNSAADWEQPAKHQSKWSVKGPMGLSSSHIESDEYFVSLDWTGQASFTAEKAHAFLLTPARGNARLEFTAAFSPRPLNQHSPSAAATFTGSAEHWKSFWIGGGAIELAGSRDRRAPELERRIVLSQYLTAIQCAGSMPPQETGLTVNSWYGKFHLEMHWWHAAHFALWNRLSLLERSLGWYHKILPSARNLAGHKLSGARWPKMVGPEDETVLPDGPY